VFVPESIPTKLQYINEHLGRAAAVVHDQSHRLQSNNGDGNGDGVVRPMYLNFLSASNFWKRACWPENIAKIVNRGMEEWMCVGHGLEDAPAREREPGRVVDHAGAGGVRKKGKGDGGTGVVIMDFVGESGDWDLVELVVCMNMGILLQTQQMIR
jgi:1-phosphatidylinositol phosphodiesterase